MEALTGECGKNGEQRNIHLFANGVIHRKLAISGLSQRASCGYNCVGTLLEQAV
jgi:hypothetical protein